MDTFATVFACTVGEADLDSATLVHYDRIARSLGMTGMYLADVS